MLELANTTVSVLRGTVKNDWGDKTNVGTPLYTGVPAALVESSKMTFDGASQRRQVVRTTTCVVPVDADVVDTDTLLDETTGNAFMIESISAQPTLGPPPTGKILILRWRSGVSVQSD